MIPPNPDTTGVPTPDDTGDQGNHLPAQKGMKQFAKHSDRIAAGDTAQS